MAKYVSADTITEITTSPGFLQPHQSVSSPPSAEDLVKSIRADLAAQLDLAERRERGQAPRDAGRNFQHGAPPSSSEVRDDIRQFEQILKEVPPGFALTPVVYSRITTAENALIKNEYSYLVRPSFLRFCAEHHADELKNLGICDSGIDRMRNGLDPADEQGELYSVNIDHILERAGSGMYGKTKAPDADNPGMAEAYKPNHFGNLMLIPEKVHEFKNALNDLQRASYTSPGNTKWILMMTPLRDAAHSGFVCPPLPASHRLSGLDTRGTDNFAKVEHGQYVLGVTLNHIDRLRDMGDLRTTVRDLVAKADALNGTVAEIAEAEAAKNGESSFRKAFDAAVRKDAGTADHLDKLVRPALVDVSEQVNSLYTRLTQNLATPKDRAAFWEFAHFMRSPKMQDLRFDVEALPFEEASQLSKTLEKMVPEVQKTCDRLDAELDAIRRLRGSNDNSSAFNGASQRNGRNDNRPATGGPRDSNQPSTQRDDFGRRIRTGR